MGEQRGDPAHNLGLPTGRKFPEAKSVKIEFLGWGLFSSQLPAFAQTGLLLFSFIWERKPGPLQGRP